MSYPSCTWYSAASDDTEDRTARPVHRPATRAGVELDGRRMTRRAHLEGPCPRSTARWIARGEALRPTPGAAGTRSPPAGSPAVGSDPSSPPKAPDSCRDRVPASSPLPDTSTTTISSSWPVAGLRGDDEVPGERRPAGRPHHGFGVPGAGSTGSWLWVAEPVPQVHEHRVAPDRLETQPAARAGVQRDDQSRQQHHAHADQPEGCQLDHAQRQQQADRSDELEHQQPAQRHHVHRQQQRDDVGAQRPRLPEDRGHHQAAEGQDDEHQRTR